ncbi:hypothetical protein [Microbispora sp. NBRC 16548]|uniref:hypothetical protein n=1 Tax=Microbispora sp. NBRC 16548 TaxID=3030994 RepID=UPI0017DB6F66|nr:hypothetical protein [Microbispora sp. NBRC 16548]GLX09358.1 hypothetical protein Misp03_62840 [Microbispora sp. NBRC 16548]
MRKIVAVAVLAAMTMLGTVAAVASVAAGTGGHPRTGPWAGSPPQAPAPPKGGVKQQEVSQKQYDILVGQCRYPKTPEARHRCRTQVREQYRVGAFNPNLDCRTYSGVSVCGVLELDAAQRSCVEESVGGGLTRRRAEVECYAFR